MTMTMAVTFTMTVKEYKGCDIARDLEAKDEDKTHAPKMALTIKLTQSRKLFH